VIMVPAPLVAAETNTGGAGMLLVHRLVDKACQHVAVGR